MINRQVNTWVRELRRHGCVVTGCVRWDEISESMLPIPWRVSVRHAPRGVGDFSCPRRTLQPLMLWLYVRRVRKAVNVS